MSGVQVSPSGRAHQSPAAHVTVSRLPGRQVSPALERQPVTRTTTRAAPDSVP